MENIKRNITSQVLDTIGYAEAENKENFMVGHSVTFIKTSEYYERIINEQKNNIECYKRISEEYKADLKMLSSIINRYSEDN
jgi:hypothetical protein